MQDILTIVCGFSKNVTPSPRSRGLSGAVWSQRKGQDTLPTVVAEIALVSEVCKDSVIWWLQER